VPRKWNAAKRDGEVRVSPPPPYDTATTATEVRLHLYGALPESKVQPDYILQLKAEGVYMYPGDTKFTTDA